MHYFYYFDVKNGFNAPNRDIIYRFGVLYRIFVLLLCQHCCIALKPFTLRVCEMFVQNIAKMFFAKNGMFTSKFK